MIHICLSRKYRHKWNERTEPIRIGQRTIAHGMGTSAYGTLLSDDVAMQRAAIEPEAASRPGRGLGD